MYQIAMFFLHFNFREYFYGLFEFMTFRTKPDAIKTDTMNKVEEGEVLFEKVDVHAIER